MTFVQVFSNTPLHICLRHGGRYKAISKFLLDLEDIDLNAEDNDGSTPFIKAFNRPEHESIVLQMLKNPTVRIVHRAKSAQVDILSMVGLWDWMAVETELVHRDVAQVFAFGPDGFNYLTRFAFNGRKSKVIGLLSLLNDHGDRLRESVGEGPYSITRHRSFSSLSRMYGYQSHVLTRMPAGSDINDEHRVFHHLLHLCAQQDVRYLFGSPPSFSYLFLNHETCFKSNLLPKMSHDLFRP